MKNYMVHTKGKKDYMIIEGYRYEFSYNNMVVDFAITEKLLNKFDNNIDCLFEYFANICDCKARTFIHLTK